MSRADLHLHSRYSVSSSEYLIRMMQLNESYTAIDTLYAQAKARGMDFVTVTDHDTIDGALELVARHPGDSFVSVEVTARFPEDHCKAHVLVYGIDERRFAHVQSVRRDIYELRDYLVTEGLPHSLAHATYNMDGVLQLHHLQKFILLFDVFEGCNGGRNADQNQGWGRILSQLTADKIGDLYRIHRIEPAGPEPWVKGLTGSSDDHAGVFIGTSWTRSPAVDIPGFLDSIRTKQTGYGGEHGNFRKMAFSFYKIVYDHMRSRPGKAELPSGLQTFSKALFDGTGIGLRDRVRLNRARRHREPGNRLPADLLGDVAARFGTGTRPQIDQEDIEWLYGRLSRYLDEYFSHVLDGCGNFSSVAESSGMLKKVMSFLPVPLLSMPFIATSKIIFTTSSLVHEAEENLYGRGNPLEKPALWFTDTIVDLNGVTETLKLFCNGAREMGMDLTLVVCLPEGQATDDLPSNTLCLAPIHNLSSGIYPSYTVYFPSFLESIRQVADRAPREIIVSTPGPMGIPGTDRSEDPGDPLPERLPHRFQGAAGADHRSGHGPTPGGPVLPGILRRHGRDPGSLQGLHRDPGRARLSPRTSHPVRTRTRG